MATKTMNDLGFNSFLEQNKQLKKTPILNERCVKVTKIDLSFRNQTRVGCSAKWKIFGEKKGHRT